MEDEKNEKEGVSDKQVTLEEVAKCAELMELINSDYSQVFDWPEELRVAFMIAAGKVSRPQREEFRQAKKDWQKAQRRKEQERDKHARKETGIRKAREATIFEAPKLLTAAQLTDERPELSTPRNCYVCKKEYTKLHHFYDTMCDECGDLNYMKRFQTADLTGQVAVVTGSRLKIGYHILL